MRAILARTLQYSCTALLLAQVAAPAAAQPRIPFPSVRPVTAQAEALMGSLSSAMDPNLALGDLSNHAASSISAALQDDIARLEAILRDLRAQRRIIHERLETTPPSKIDQIRKLERKLQQVEAEIARCERQLAALLEEQEREKRRQSPAQQGPLSGGRFAFSNPAEQGERMPGTYTARNGRIFAATLLQLPGNAWAALVRTSGPSAADMIARNDARAAGALGLKIKGAGGGYRVVVWGGSSDPQAAVINPQAAVAGAPLFESPRFSERGVVRFLGLAEQVNDSLGAGIIPAAALVAVARQPASFAGGGSGRPGPEPERAPPPRPTPTLTPTPTPTLPPGCSAGSGQLCTDATECCNRDNPTQTFECRDSVCRTTCNDDPFSHDPYGSCFTSAAPCCTHSPNNVPLVCQSVHFIPTCIPNCPSNTTYVAVGRFCRCSDPRLVFNGTECATPTPTPTPTPSRTPTFTPTPSCSGGTGTLCNHHTECCDPNNPSQTFFCATDRRCFPTCISDVGSACMAADLQNRPCCTNSNPSLPLECSRRPGTDGASRCWPNCPPGSTYFASEARCQCDTPGQIFNGTACVTPTPTPRPPPGPRGGCAISGNRRLCLSELQGSGARPCDDDSQCFGVEPVETLTASITYTPSDSAPRS